MTWVIGQKLQGGKYTIKEELGLGGFGITYLAMDNNQRKVVIKTLNETIQKNPDFDKFKQDFEHEAQRLRKCSHPHIVKVYDSFQEDSLPYIVLEYIDGENLAEWVNKYGVFSESEALNYIQQIGEALKVIHNKGLLHRDLKPENIMLRVNKSEAVLIDFGIAREFAPNLTVSHTQFISDYYSPIEQYDRRAKRDVYTDIYSLAATLYVILTKELPVPAPVRAVGTQLQQPKQLNPNISNKVNNAILQGMALKPSDRPQSVEKWLKSLGIKNTNTTINLTTQVTPDSGSAKSKKNSLFWFGIGLTTALITFGLGSFGYHKWTIYQELKVVEEIERLKINESYVECINKSLNVPKNSHKYEDAQNLLNECASEQLAQAQNYVKNKDFKEGIVAAKLIPTKSYFYQEAQNLISQASDNLFSQAKNLYEKEGNIEKAITLTKSIPDNIRSKNKIADTIIKWRNDWRANEALFKDAQTALDEGKWYKARKVINKLTTNYWQNQANSINKTVKNKIAAIEREQLAKENWEKAVEKANNYRYKEAIYMAKKIPSKTSRYRKAQSAIPKWTKKLGLEGFKDGKYFYEDTKDKGKHLLLKKQGRNIIGYEFYPYTDYEVCFKGVIKNNTITNGTIAYYPEGSGAGLDGYTDMSGAPVLTEKLVFENYNSINLSKWYKLNINKIDNHLGFNFNMKTLQICEKRFS